MAVFLVWLSGKGVSSGGFKNHGKSFSGLATLSAIG
jgi:hypothetical protein